MIEIEAKATSGGARVDQGVAAVSCLFIFALGEISGLNCVDINFDFEKKTLSPQNESHITKQRLTIEFRRKCQFVAEPLFLVLRHLSLTFSSSQLLRFNFRHTFILGQNKI